MSLGLSALGLLLAVLPRGEGSNPRVTLSHWSRPVLTLMRSPIVWLGLGLLVYVSVQGLNSAWRFAIDANSWWLDEVAHVSWLPSGVDAPFSRSNPWRALTIWGSLGLLLCSVTIGFQRRRSYLTLFIILASNAGLLGLLGLIQRLSAAKGIFWFYVPSNDQFISSFIYPNHAGPYFNLMLALSAGLALRAFDRTQRRLLPRGSATFFVGCATFVAIAIVLSHSRMSIAILLLLMSLMGLAVFWSLIRRRQPGRSRRQFLPLLLVVIGFLAIGVLVVSGSKNRERFIRVASDPSAQTLDRTLLRQAAVDMLGDRWVWGWGAGCFRHAFPLFAQKYPEIYYSRHAGTKYWEHAHCDLLQFPVELGAVGITPVLSILGYSVYQLRRCRFWQNSVSLCIAMGCALVLLHSAVDFVFQNPAVLLTWSLLLLAAIRWKKLDSPLRARRFNQRADVRS